MLAKHPKALYVISLVSFFERMAYYILFAVLTLFIQSSYNISLRWTGVIYALFLFFVYILGIGGGWLADRRLGYERSCLAGMVIMLAGYVLLVIPCHSPALLLVILFILAVGNGLYKSNMVTLLGEAYEGNAFKGQRDAGFNIFYMSFNAGAMISPFLAFYASTITMRYEGFSYDPRLYELARKFLAGMFVDELSLRQLMAGQPGYVAGDITAFCRKYLEAVSMGYHVAFGIAALAMAVALLIFVLLKKQLAFSGIRKTTIEDETLQNKANDRERVQLLLMVMAVMMFFWMSFYQNGYALTLFANQYVVSKVNSFTFLFFDFVSVVLLVPVFIFLSLILRKEIPARWKVAGALFAVASGLAIMFRYKSFSGDYLIKAEMFQYFNPFFCLVATPFLLLLFRKLGDKQPSTRQKMMLGMLLTALAFLLLSLGSLHLPSPHSLQGGISFVQVSPWWLIGMYFITTVAELLLNPIGMSFVSKVSPPHLRGLMQGSWFGSMAAGNLLSGIVGAFLWNSLELWQFFLIFIVTSFISAQIIFLLGKKFKKVCA